MSKLYLVFFIVALVAFANGLKNIFIEYFFNLFKFYIFIKIFDQVHRWKSHTRQTRTRNLAKHLWIRETQPNLQHYRHLKIYPRNLMIPKIWVRLSKFNKLSPSSEHCTSKYAIKSFCCCLFLFIMFFTVYYLSCLIRRITCNSVHYEIIHMLTFPQFYE